MREAVAEAVPELLARCIELVGQDPFPQVGESTRYAQPAIYCASVASWISFEQALMEGELPGSWRPSAFAGHSLGEIAALVAAEAISVETGLELAVLRGALMAQAGEQDGGGGLVALLGADEEQCRRLAQAHEASLANDNAPGQIVLAGRRERLRELVSHARELGVRAIMLDVTGAFHSPAMVAAVEPFQAALESAEIQSPRHTVISCCSGQEIVDVRGELAQAIVRPVRWRETMLRLSAQGTVEFLDLGPGKILATLVSRNLAQANGVQAQMLLAQRQPEAVAQGGSQKPHGQNRSVEVAA